MFERMEITESIYKGVVLPYHKIPTREYANHAVHRKKMRGESALSNNYSNMTEISGKCRKRYVDHKKGRYKPTYLIHGPEN